MVLQPKRPFYYESLIKVPFIFSYPKKFSKAKKVDSLIMSYDIMPTICDLAKISKPKITAKSLIPLLSGDENPRDAIMVEGFNKFQNRTVIYNGCKMNFYPTTNEGEIYNLIDDSYGNE